MNFYTLQYDTDDLREDLERIGARRRPER